MLKSVREAKGLTQEQLAALVGLTRPAISQFENGTSSPSMAVAKRLACALDCTLDDLFPLSCSPDTAAAPSPDAA